MAEDEVNGLISAQRVFPSASVAGFGFPCCFFSVFFLFFSLSFIDMTARMKEWISQVIKLSLQSSAFIILFFIYVSVFRPSFAFHHFFILLTKITNSLFFPISLSTLPPIQSLIIIFILFLFFFLPYSFLLCSLSRLPSPLSRQFHMYMYVYILW